MALQNRKYSTDITNRFLAEMDQLINQNDNKAAAFKTFSEVVQVTQSNLIRLRNPKNSNCVTLEAVARMCDYYKIPPAKIILGKDDLSQQTGRVMNAGLQNIDKAVKEISVALSSIRKMTVNRNVNTNSKKVLKSK